MCLALKGAKEEPQAMTNLYGALELVFNDCQAVRRWNRERNVAIHTMALLVGKYGALNPNPRGGSTPVEDRQRLLRFLKQLSKENGGVCRVFMD